MDKDWFKKHLRMQGKTSSDLATAIGRDRAVVSRIMNGHQELSLEQAKAFANELSVDVSEVLTRANMTDATTARAFSSGFSESDAAAWIPGPSLTDGNAVKTIAAALGADRPGVDIWRVKSRAMVLGGLLEGDYMLIDTHQSERAKAGDTVIAQVYNNASGTAVTLLRRFAPPVLVAASVEPGDQAVHVVDGTNVVTRGRVIASWRM